MPHLTEEEILVHMKNAGQCEGFRVSPILELCNMLVAYDEPVRALAILDGIGLPGFYRDHIPAEILDLKRRIHAKLATPHFYKENVWDKIVEKERSIQSIQHTLRGRLITDDVAALNKAGHNPHIVDMGPGEYWLPIGLKELGHKFTYKDIGLSIDAAQKAQELLKDEMGVAVMEEQPVMFIACEIIEHLYNEGDLRVEMERHAPNAEIIHISTPKYTFDGRLSQLEWQKKGDLGHLRTYTPTEFWNVVTKMFWDFDWQAVDPSKTEILHMRGTKRGNT